MNIPPWIRLQQKYHSIVKMCWSCFICAFSLSPTYQLVLSLLRRFKAVFKLPSAIIWFWFSFTEGIMTSDLDGGAASINESAEITLGDFIWLCFFVGLYTAFTSSTTTNRPNWKKKKSQDSSFQQQLTIHFTLLNSPLKIQGVSLEALCIGHISDLCIHAFFLAHF